MKVLIIEDYEPLLKSLCQGLKENGYVVDAVGDGEEGLLYAGTGQYDVVVLDLRLPDMDGLEILKRLRLKQDPVPILILTARDTVRDRVTGLNLGADDYLVKPFEFSELLARIRALTRRKYESKSPIVRIGDLEVDLVARKARRAGKNLNLTSKEFSILEMLILRTGRVVSRDEIRENVYDFASETGSNVIDVFIGRLRRKLEGEGRGRLLHTRRGFGYVLGKKEE